MSIQNFSSNQFNNNIPVKGDTALNPGFNVLPVMLDPDSVATLVPGDAVVLSTQDGTTIMVEKALATDIPFGFVLYNLKKNTFTAGQALEIACNGTMIYGQSQSTIDRGDYLEYVPNTDDPYMKSNAGTNPISGIAVDNAGANEIFRFIIIGSQTFAPTISGGIINNTPIGQATPNVGAFTTLSGGSTNVTTLADAIVALTPATTISLDPTLGGLFTVVPAQNETINAASVPTKHQGIVIIVTTSGTTSYTITFGTHFKSTGTLTTGATSGKVFALRFEGDGTNFNEIARTTAM